MKITDERTPRRLAILFAALVVLFWSSVEFLEFYHKHAESEQTRMIIAEYYQKAARGQVPGPADTNAIRLFRKERGAPPTTMSVKTVSGETNWFSITQLDGDSGTNWSFRPK